MIAALSEVSDLDTGLLLEVWEKGLLWDKVGIISKVRIALGGHHIQHNI